MRKASDDPKMFRSRPKAPRVSDLRAVARDEREAHSPVPSSSALARCEECRGTGYVPVTIGLTTNFECPKCDGSGLAVLSQGYIIELAEGGPWLKRDLTWTPHRGDRGIWHEIADAELAIARSLQPNAERSDGA